MALLFLILFGCIIAAILVVVVWEAIDRLKNRNRYFLVIEYKDGVSLLVFTKRDEWREAWEREYAKAKIDKGCLRVVQFEKDEIGFIRTGFFFSRTDELLKAATGTGDLTGEAKILTFPKRKSD